VKRLSVGIVVALKVEAAALTREVVQPECLLPLANGGGLWLSGMGPTAARKAALALVEAGAQALATFGVAGALEGHLHTGMLICPRSIVDQQGLSHTTDPIWRERLQLRLAAAGLAAIVDVALVSLAQPLSTVAAKRAAQNLYRAQAVDMESAAVAAVAASHDLPFIVLRAIVDERDDELPEALQAAIDAWGQPRWAQLFTALLRHPDLLVRLPGLSARMNKARGALSRAALAAPDLEAPAAVRCTEAW
jgi:adenosylhomocysteine nucleosidase